MLQNIFCRFCRKRTGVTLIAGAVGVLTGVEYLIGSQKRPTRKRVGQVERTQTIKAVREDYFNIRRTKSELGYTYWVLQGFGQYRGFTLFDTWQEAMEQATVRLKSSAQYLLLTPSIS